MSNGYGSNTPHHNPDYVVAFSSLSQPGYSSPSVLQRVMAPVAWLMVFVVPTWVAFGHVVLNSGGGWVAVVTFFVVVPVGLILTVAHAILAEAYGRQIGKIAVAPKASIVALVFTVAAVIFPFFVSDIGDDGPGNPARVRVWFGFSDAFASSVALFLSVTMLVAAILVIIFDIIELIYLRRRSL